ncbi:hypothetical protein L6D95_10070, partial [Enterococcus faecium]|nr:hypothetical protein [Enterococcus faecium]
NLFDQSINQCKITKNLSQNVVHSDSDLILHNSSVLIDKEPQKSCHSPLFRTNGVQKLASAVISPTKRKNRKSYFCLAVLIT